MAHVLGVVYRCQSGWLIKQAGYTKNTAKAGAETLIQRFGSALNLNIHFHRLFLDGVLTERADCRLRFQWVREPVTATVARLNRIVATRIGR
jgi:limonene-1,2-epoxide hydrolase